MKKLLFLLWLLPVVSFAQKIVINGKEGNRPLTWKDFTGKVNKETSYWAMTYWEMKWNFRNVEAMKTGAMPEIGIDVAFTDESWANSKKELSDELLKHEQVHFDIAILCAAQLQKRLDDTTFDMRTFRVGTVNRIFQETIAKCKQMQLQYDRETNHSKNVEEQEKWNAVLAKELMRYKQLASAAN